MAYVTMGESRHEVKKRLPVMADLMGTQYSVTAALKGVSAQYDV